MAIELSIEKKFKGFSLQVQWQGAASSMGILGPSGSGKSMTLKCIAGIETPDRGRIVINGKTVFDSEKRINLKPQERQVGYLFQNYALFPTMTVRQNIACSFRGRRESLEAKTEEYIRRYHLEGLEERRPSQLSGGQQQRTALARMMIGEPQAILLDEPFSALDESLKDMMQKEMEEFLRDYPGDMLLVTHSRDEVFRFCRELMLLENGRTLTTGETRQIFDRPGLLQAARLTGCRNDSPAERLDSHHVYATDWNLCLCTAEPVGEEITHVGIRGHWLRPSAGSGENRMPVEMAEHIETTFEHQYLMRNAKEKDAAPVWWMRPKRSFGEKPEEGIPPYLYFPPEQIMLLKE